MQKDKNIAELSPEERRREVASILGRGVLRLIHRQRLNGKVATTPPTKIPLESAAGSLEVSAETVLSVHTG